MVFLSFTLSLSLSCTGLATSCDLLGVDKCDVRAQLGEYLMPFRGRFFLNRQLKFRFDSVEGLRVDVTDLDAHLAYFACYLMKPGKKNISHDSLA